MADPSKLVIEVPISFIANATNPTIQDNIPNLTRYQYARLMSFKIDERMTFHLKLVKHIGSRTLMNNDVHLKIT